MRSFGLQGLGRFCCYREGQIIAGVFNAGFEIAPFKAG